MKLFAYTPHSTLHTLQSTVLEKLTGSQIVKKFPALHRTQRFITAFGSAHHLSLPSPRSIQSIPPIPLPEDVILPSTLRSSKWSLSLRLNKIQVFIYFACSLKSQHIFKKQHLSLHSSTYPWQKVVSLLSCPGKLLQRKLLFIVLYIRGFYFLFLIS